MYIHRISKRISQIDEELLELFSSALLDTWSQEGVVYVIGNGGSAATSQHFATDIQKLSMQRGLQWRILSLNDNNSLVTMIGNDYSFDEIFSRQLTILLRRNDLLICISASGNSRNIQNAVEIARKRGTKSMGIVGFNGGWLKQNASVCLNIETDMGDYGVAEDLHMILCHSVKEYLSQRQIP
jgi:D-sedoheptulose 7-phosphate isomerase